nr:NS3 [Wongorr virus]
MMLQATELAHRKIQPERIPLNAVAVWGTAPPPEQSERIQMPDQNAYDRQQALSILTNAVSSTTGASEVVKNEKAYFGATSEALKDDEPTRQAKYYAYKQSIYEFEKDIKSAKRRAHALCVVAWICMIGIVLCLGVQWAFDTDMIPETSNSTLVRKLRNARGIVEMILGFALMWTVRARERLSATARSLERDMIKRRAYTDTVKRMRPPPLADVASENV